ncbi:hypothetical protein EVAR_59657_1 [Eumeta japonica]|uniref:Uncharacterized protein n=1 Tax=Eumeta variegata TaxID=151549 RepID=A0A4C1Z071_EUMVA|nr:hypothetical protein EVAR_59657_1 [Eumeta japonica]
MSLRRTGARLRTEKCAIINIPPRTSEFSRHVATMKSGSPSSTFADDINKAPPDISAVRHIYGFGKFDVYNSSGVPAAAGGAAGAGRALTPFKLPLMIMNAGLYRSPPPGRHTFRPNSDSSGICCIFHNIINFEKREMGGNTEKKRRSAHPQENGDSNIHQSVGSVKATDRRSPNHLMRHAVMLTNRIENEAVHIHNLKFHRTRSKRLGSRSKLRTTIDGRRTTEVEQHGSGRGPFSRRSRRVRCRCTGQP